MTWQKLRNILNGNCAGDTALLVTRVSECSQQWTLLLSLEKSQNLPQNHYGWWMFESPDADEHWKSLVKSMHLDVLVDDCQNSPTALFS